MPVITAPPEPTHTLEGTAFTSLATPSRGSRDTSVWRVELDPGVVAQPHSLTREEVFVVLAGTATVTLDGERSEAGPGDAIVVPVATSFGLANAGTEPLSMVCCMPAGGQAELEDGTLLSPPWSL